MTELEDRVARLEATLEALTHPASGAPPDRGAVDGTSAWPEPFLLDELRRRFPDGAVAFAGHGSAADGPVAWQWGRPTDALLEQDWELSAAPLAALGHPVRLRLLQLVLTGTRTTADLAADPDLATTGQLHHHLRTLLAAGWLQSAGRGRYAVPAQRVIPLLIIVAATES